MAPVRPLVVTNDYPPDVGGIQQYVDNLVSRLPGAAVFAPWHPDAARHDAGAGAPVYRSTDPPDRWHGPGGWMLPTQGVTAQVAAAVAAHRADVVVFAAPWPLVPIARALGLPTVVMTHGAELVIPARLPGAGAALGARLHTADLLTTVSAFTGAHLRRLVGPDGPPIRLVPPGVQLDRFSPAAEGAAVRRRHGLDDDPTAVFVGRHVPRKGIDLLVAHWDAVRSRVPAARLLVTGSGDLTPVLRARAARLPEGAVVFTGRVPDDELAAHHAAGHVFVHPNRSRWLGLEQEGFGIIFLEAQAVGRPVVAGRSGGAPETLVPGETGLLVDGADPADVVAAVSRLLADRPRAARMGRAGREYVATHFDWDDIAARFADDLAAVAAGATVAPDR